MIRWTPRMFCRRSNGFEPVWNSLRTHQQTRIVNLLVERVGYDGRTGKITVAFRSQGMRELCSGRKVE